MNKFLTELIQTIAVAAILVCAAFLIRFLCRQSGLLSIPLESTQSRELLDGVVRSI